MSLQGNLKTMSLADLLRFLAMRKSTGTLQLTRLNEWKKLFFENGKIISCGSSDPKEYLGHFLISENKINEEQLSHAMEVQNKTKVMLGKILVMIGAITEEELLRLLETKTLESILGAFLWDDAEFEFLDNELPAVRQVPLMLDVEAVVRAGNARIEEWNRLRQEYPSKKIRLVKKASSIGEAQLEDELAKKVYGLVNSERTIEDMLMNTHSAVYKVLHVIDTLRQQNLIGISASREQEESSPAITVIPTAQMIEMGKSKLAFGKFEEAINLFKYVLKHEQNPQVAELLSRSEDGLVRSIYEQVISASDVPKLARPLEQLAGEKLSSEESFLVTRINGQWDLKSILTITPLREVDALRMIKRLIDRKIVRCD